MPAGTFYSSSTSLSIPDCPKTPTVSLHHSGDVQPVLHSHQAHAVLEIKGITGKREEKTVNSGWLVLGGTASSAGPCTRGHTIPAPNGGAIAGCQRPQGAEGLVWPYCRMPT